MSMISDNSQLESYDAVYDVVPENWEDARPFFVEQLKKVSNAINIRAVGFYLDEELLTGKAFIPGVTLASAEADSDSFRSIIRKVVDIGALPAAGTKLVPHGITVDANFTLVQMYGASTDPVNLLSIPLPFVEVNVPALLGVQLLLDSTNIQISVGSNRSQYTRGYIVIEYMQEL